MVFLFSTNILVCFVIIILSKAGSFSRSVIYRLAEISMLDAEADLRHVRRAKIALSLVFVRR